MTARTQIWRYWVLLLADDLVLGGSINCDPPLADLSRRGAAAEFFEIRSLPKECESCESLNPPHWSLDDSVLLVEAEPFLSVAADQVDHLGIRSIPAVEVPEPVAWVTEIGLNDRDSQVLESIMSTGDAVIGTPRIAVKLGGVLAGVLRQGVIIMPLQFGEFRSRSQAASLVRELSGEVLEFQAVTEAELSAHREQLESQFGIAISSTKDTRAEIAVEQRRTSQLRRAQSALEKGEPVDAALRILRENPSGEQEAGDL